MQYIKMMKFNSIYVKIEQYKIHQILYIVCYQIYKKNIYNTNLNNNLINQVHNYHYIYGVNMFNQLNL